MKRKYSENTRYVSISVSSIWDKKKNSWRSTAGRAVSVHASRMVDVLYRDPASGPSVWREDSWYKEMRGEGKKGGTVGGGVFGR